MHSKTSLRPSPTKLSHVMTSDIPKILGDCQKIKLQNFSICDIINPFVLPTRVCVVINCSKLLFTHFPRQILTVLEAGRTLCYCHCKSTIVNNTK